MKSIVQYTDGNAAVLRTVAQKIPVEDIQTEHIQLVIENMKKALSSQEDGVAIAAPQIGEPLRIFVISPKMFDSDTPESDITDRHLVYINPRIVNVSKKTIEMEEGCLSVRWLYGKVTRHEKAEVEAYDEHGLRFRRGGSGLLAQIFQHETDHLDGTLFIDKANDVQEYEPEQQS